MNRMLIWLVSAFLVLAAGTGIGIYFWKFRGAETPKKPVSQLNAVIPVPTAVPLFINVLKPTLDTEIINSEVLVSGKTKPGTTVIIYSDDDQTITESDIAGIFEDSILVPDNNAIVTITAIDDNGVELSSSLILKDNQLTASRTQATPVSDRVLAKTTEIKNKPDPKVKDFLENKPAVKARQKLGADKIKGALQKNSTASAVLRKSIVKTTKKIKAVEATTSAALKRKAVSGVITAISGATITVQHQIQNERTWTVYFNEQTVVTGKDLAGSNSANLKVGLRIAAVGEISESGLLAKRIHIIPGKSDVIPRATLTPVNTATISATPTIKAIPTATATPSATLVPTITTTPSVSTPSATPML